MGTDDSVIVRLVVEEGTADGVESDLVDGGATIVAPAEAYEVPSELLDVLGDQQFDPPTVIRVPGLDRGEVIVVRGESNREFFHVKDRDEAAALLQSVLAQAGA